MADVFISYARSDQKIARRLASALQKAGYSLWWDAELPAHRSYSEEIESELRKAKAVVVLWSKEAAKSQWVRAEADVARNGAKLVQLTIDGAIPPIPFNQIQCADLTGWRGGNAHRGFKKALDSVSALTSGKSSEKAAPNAVPKPLWSRDPWRWAAGALVLLLVAGAIFLTRSLNGSDGKPVVAVLPFESLDNRDESLVAGMWEDTRQAIGRNPQLLVLGPNTAQEIAGKGSEAASKLADYLVEASVRSAGDRIRVNANLVRTDDGTEIWNKSFDRRLDNVFELQQEIAEDIEGHIRGRLAERGGIKPENIATSGEVYALYSDARSKIRKRQMTRYDDALRQLEQVVRRDPNFAPGWATLAVAKNFAAAGALASTSEADARRAISLAPNLAAGHAALGLILREGPAAQASLRRALELDPNDFEAMHWLANSLDPVTQRDEKLALYSRVVELEPLWWPAISNKMNLLFESGDPAAVDRELARVESLGDALMAAAVRAEILQRRGDLSGAIRAALPHLKNAQPGQRERIGQFVLGSLVQLGMFETLDQISPPVSDYVPYLRKNDPRALDIIERQMSASAYWSFGPLPMVAGRVYLNNGQGRRLAARYRAAAANPKQFMRLVGEHRFVAFAPMTAMALRADGKDQEADELLSIAEEIGKKPSRPNEHDLVALARVHAVQGRTREGMALLSEAVRRGWLPNYFEIHTDLALDPPLIELRKDPGFERLRQKILRHLAKERAELGSIRLD